MIDTNISIPQNHIDAGRIASGQERCPQAVDAAKQPLRTRVASMQSDSSIETIFEIRQTIPADESFYNRGRNSIEPQGLCAEHRSFSIAPVIAESFRTLCAEVSRK